MTELIKISKRNYYSERINSSLDSKKLLFACVKELLNRNTSSGLSSGDSADEISNHIATYFEDKISAIRAYLEDRQKKLAVSQGTESMLVP